MNHGLPVWAQDIDDFPETPESEDVACLREFFGKSIAEDFHCLREIARDLRDMQGDESLAVPASRFLESAFSSWNLATTRDDVSKADEFLELLQESVAILQKQALLRKPAGLLDDLRCNSERLRAMLHGFDPSHGGIPQECRLPPCREDWVQREKFLRATAEDLPEPALAETISR